VFISASLWAEKKKTKTQRYIYTETKAQCNHFIQTSRRESPGKKVMCDDPSRIKTVQEV
jgi:hypothetical protein